MAKTNLFKSFQIAEITDAAYEGVKAAAGHDMEPFRAIDPSKTSWRSMGLTEPLGMELMHDLDGYAVLMAVMFNERMLPAKVRDEKVAIKVANLADATGRKVGKKEYAQIREEVEMELLPKAFIKRNVVPVAFLRNQGVPLMVFFTSSPKKMEGAFLTIRNALCGQPGVSPFRNGLELRAIALSTVHSMTGVLTQLAKEGSSEDGGFKQKLFTDASIVLRGEVKRTIRVKDRAIESHEIQILLDQGYQASELALVMSDGERESMSCTVTDKLIFKGADVPEREEESNEADLHGTAMIRLRTYMEFLVLLLEEAGGIQRATLTDDPDEEEGSESEETPADAAVEDDDDL